MGKILLLVLLGFVAYALWRGAQAKKARPASRDEAAPRRDRSGGVERMVRCERCGVHLPVGEAYLVAGRHYCSAEHAGTEQR